MDFFSVGLNLAISCAAVYLYLSHWKVIVLCWYCVFKLINYIYLSRKYFTGNTFYTSNDPCRPFDCLFGNCPNNLCFAHHLMGMFSLKYCLSCSSQSIQRASLWFSVAYWVENGTSTQQVCSHWSNQCQNICSQVNVCCLKHPLRAICYYIWRLTGNKLPYTWQDRNGSIY